MENVQVESVKGCVQKSNFLLLPKQRVEGSAYFTVNNFRSRSYPKLTESF